MLNDVLSLSMSFQVGYLLPFVVVLMACGLSEKFIDVIYSAIAHKRTR